MGVFPSTCRCNAICSNSGDWSLTAVESVNVAAQKSASVTSTASARSLSVAAEFPVYCLEMLAFMKLEHMQKHEDVFDELVEPADDRMVHFISHEWLGFQHPDPDATQLKRIQTVLAVFIAGEARSLFKEGDWEAFCQGVSAGTAPHFHEFETSLAGREIRTGADISEHVKEGVVWLDYHSIPQTRKDDVFVKAVNGIPHYVERCDYFWVCAPTAIHKELQQPRNFLTWRSRGWCRLEDTINMLSSNLKMPLVVTCQPRLSTYGLFDGMWPYMGRPERSIFNGNFTCCQRNHQIQQPDGTFKRIACDKQALTPMLRRSFYNRMMKPSEAERFKINLFRDLAGAFFAGLPEEEELWKPDPEESLDEALDRLGYSSLEDRDEFGWLPVSWMVSQADFSLFERVCQARPDLLEQDAMFGWTTLLGSVWLEHDKFARLLYLYPERSRLATINASSAAGYTAVEQAAKGGFCENLQLLIKEKGNLEAKREDNGATPLLSAAEGRYPCCCRALLEHRADVAAVDKEGFTALHLAVDPLTLLGNTAQGCTLEVIKVLLEARASLSAQDRQGRTPIDLAKELHLEGEDGLALMQMYAHRQTGKGPEL